MKCTTADCGKDVSTVGEVRGCAKCQANGTAAAVHAAFLNTDSIEKLVSQADPGAFPFESEPLAAPVVERSAEHERKIKVTPKRSISVKKRASKTVRKHG